MRPQAGKGDALAQSAGAQLRQELRGECDDLRAELEAGLLEGEAELAGLRAELTEGRGAELAGLRAELERDLVQDLGACRGAVEGQLRGECIAVRAEFAAGLDEIRGRRTAELAALRAELVEVAAAQTRRMCSMHADLRTKSDADTLTRSKSDVDVLAQRVRGMHADLRNQTRQNLSVSVGTLEAALGGRVDEISGEMEQLQCSVQFLLSTLVDNRTTVRRKLCFRSERCPQPCAEQGGGAG